MSIQNPTLPTATQAKGIDAIVLDLQTHLDTELVWLTNGLGRAYKMTKVRANQSNVFLPEVYLGGDRFKYFAATPDNDKQAQNIFIVGDCILPDFQKNFYGLLEYPVDIIFTANLSTIDNTLLTTEDFTEHLIIDVREALIRDLTGKSYRVVIDSIQREFSDVYSEFDISNDRGVSHFPLTHFRVNCTVQFREDCNDASLNRCAAILQNLSQDDLLNCVLPTYDFSTTTTQDALTATQVSDLRNWLGCVVVARSFLIDGVNEYLFAPISAAYEFEYNSTFTLAGWVKLTTLNGGIVMGKYASPKGWFLQIQADGSVRMNIANNGGVAGLSVDTNAGVINIGIWYHIVGTYDGTNAPSAFKIYVDATSYPLNTIQNNLGNNTIKNNTIPMSLGAIPTGSSVDGLLDDCRIWNTVLSSVDVTSEYNGGTPLPTPTNIANNVLLMKGADKALYGANDFVTEDESGTVTGIQSANMESTDTSLDKP